MCCVLHEALLRPAQQRHCSCPCTQTPCTQTPCTTRYIVTCPSPSKAAEQRLRTVCRFEGGCCEVYRSSDLAKVSCSVCNALGHLICKEETKVSAAEGVRGWGQWHASALRFMLVLVQCLLLDTLLACDAGRRQLVPLLWPISALGPVRAGHQYTPADVQDATVKCCMLHKQGHNMVSSTTEWQTTARRPAPLLHCCKHVLAPTPMLRCAGPGPAVVLQLRSRRPLGRGLPRAAATAPPR
jgi:hypothetical protein